MRWLFPAKEWEIVPTTPTLAANKDITDRPTLLNRGIWSSWGYFGDTPAKRWDREPGKSRAADDYGAWGRHNLQGGSLQINTGHAWQDIIRINKAEFDAHPEYYALVGGKRYASPDGKLELGNPEVRKMVVQYALDYFRNNPNADMVSLDPSDGGGHSESPESQKLGSVSDAVFGMANEAAKAVAQKYPGKMVGLLAYNFHAMPPSFPLEPNVYIQLPTAFVQGKYTLQDLLDLWPKKAKQFGVYDYYSVYLWYHDMLPGGTAANFPGAFGSVANYAKIGASSISAESGNDWGLSGLGYYVAAKAMWNPNLDLDTLTNDFYQQAFGAGAQGMKRYYDLMAGSNRQTLSRNTYALLLLDVDEAGRAASNDAGATARIDDIKQYLRYVHLNWEWNRVNGLVAWGVITPEKEKAWNARIEQTFRERFAYMTHFAAQWQQGYIDLDSVAKNPELFPDKPFTKAERDAQWDEMLKAYPALEIHERTFSGDLVAVDFGLNTGSNTVQHFPGRAGFMFATTGQPLKFMIQTDALADFANRQEARYTIGGPKGVVAAGRMPFDGKSHDLSFNLPAGTYGLDFDGAQGSWTMQASKSQPVSPMLLKQWPRAQAGPLQDMFFYVPKGTRQIEVSYSGAPLKFTTQDGDVVVPKEHNDDFYVYSVPKGADNSVWSIPQFGLGYFWFHNLPDLLAASPQALPVPREVALADKLTILQ